MMETPTTPPGNSRATLKLVYSWELKPYSCNWRIIIMVMMMVMMMMTMVVMMMVMMLVIMMIMMIMKTEKLLSNAQVDVQLGVQLQLDHYNVFLLVLKRFHLVQNAHNAYDYSAYTDDACTDDNADDCSDDNADD